MYGPDKLSVDLLSSGLLTLLVLHRAQHLGDSICSLDKEKLLISAFGIKIWKNLRDHLVDDFYTENIPALLLTKDLCMFCSLCLE